MANVLLFHHALGLTPGVQDLATRLRDAGHQVQAPDLYDGSTFEDIEDGVAHAQQVGFDTLAERGLQVVDEADGDVAVIGLSLGVVPAQIAAQTRTTVVAAGLVSACLPVTHAAPSWPDDTPVQVHLMERDAFVTEDGDLEAAEELAASSTAAELFLYDGDAHLFMDASTEDHDAAATDLLVDRLVALLGRIG